MARSSRQADVIVVDDDLPVITRVTTIIKDSDVIAINSVKRRNRGRKRNRPVDEVIDLTCSPPINNVAKPDVYVDTSAGSPSKGKRQLECRICMGELKQPSATPCGHVFCTTCIKTALQFKKECPICRRKINHARQIHRLYI